MQHITYLFCLLASFVGPGEFYCMFEKAETEDIPNPIPNELRRPSVSRPNRLSPINVRIYRVTVT